VIEVVCERRVNISEGEGGNVRDNLVGCHALVLIPDDNVQYANAMAGDARLAATHLRRSRDPSSAGPDMTQDSGGARN